MRKLDPVILKENFYYCVQMVKTYDAAVGSLLGKENVWKTLLSSHGFTEQ